MSSSSSVDGPQRAHGARLGARSRGDERVRIERRRGRRGAVTNGWCESPVTVRMPGGDLRVELDDENRITLVGPAEEICDGDVRF